MQVTIFYQMHYMMWNIFEIHRSLMRALQLLTLIQNELKLMIYDQEHLVSFVKFKCIFISLLTFINNFDLYQNMYQFLMRIYVTSVSLD